MVEIGPTPDEKDYKEMGKTPPRISEGFSLIIGPDDGVIDNADVRVRWCVHPELQESLIKQGVKNPHVVLTTSNDDGDNEWRAIFPLNELISFARFYQAGTQRIYAVIVDMPENPTHFKTEKQEWMNMDYGMYKIQVQGNGEFRSWRKPEHDEDIYAYCVEDVVIPEGVFAKEPSGFNKWFANLWHGSNKVDDGCEYKRRLAIAYVAKWFPMLLWTIFYIPVGIIIYSFVKMIGLGKYIVDPGCVFRPFGTNLWFTMIDSSQGEFKDLRDSRFVAWNTLWPKTHAQPIFFTFMLNPAFVLTTFLISWWVQSGEMFEFYSAHVFTAIMFLIIGGIFLAIDIGTAVFYALDNWTNDTRTNYGGRMGGGVIVVGLCFLLFVLTKNLPMIAVIAFIFVIALVILLWLYCSRPPAFVRGYERFNKWLDRVFDKFYQMFEPKEDYTQMRELLCPKDMDNMSTDIHSLPTKNRSWILFYRDFKNKSCKPMQRK